MKFLSIICIIGCFLVSIDPSRAALITDVHDVPDSGRTPDSIDDPSPGQPGDVTYAFDDLDFGSPTTVDTVFTIRQSGGTSEYLIDQFFFFTPTSQPWIGIRFELGVGTGGSFEEATDSDDPQFDLSDLPAQNSQNGQFFAFTSNPWMISNSSSAVLEWSTLPFFTDLDEIGITIDIPDSDTDADTFTLRQMPIVLPEPASGLGVFLGMAMAVGRRNRRQPIICSPTN